MLRHTSLRDDRRRRSLLEDASASQEASGTAKSRRAAKTAETYTELARSDCHARWSDFVPLRNWTLAGVMLAGLVVIAILEAGYYFTSRYGLWATGGLGALDLVRPDSLAGWWSAFVMFSCAVVAAFIYSVRRYRLDDYRGRYRVWLGAAAGWTLMSIDSIADLRTAVRTLGVDLSGYVGPGDGVIWWLAPWVLFILWFGLRMVLDARTCRTATVSLVLGFLALIGGFVGPQMLISLAGELAVMLPAGCSLLGRWLIFFGHIAYARHVLLEAHGRLPVREAKPKREKKKPTSDSEDSTKAAGKTTAGSAKRRDDLTTRIDPPHTTPFQPATSGIDVQRSSAPSGNSAKTQGAGAAVASRTPAASAAIKPAAIPAKSSTQFISGDDDDESRPGNKLSRAERKRLRKQQRGDRYDDE
jgi:hypothetical protein